MIHDQVKEAGLGDVRVGYNNRNFDFYASQAIGPQSGLEVALIDAFFAQAAQSEPPRDGAVSPRVY
jgi:hypothetical protein